MQQPDFDPMAFLRLADEIVTDDDDEAILRTAVSRVHYAVFLIARSKVNVEGRRNADERVREAISPVNDRAASLLGSMSYLRLVADYELLPQREMFRNWRRNWQQVRRNADKLLQELSDLPDFAADLSGGS
jgi:hypothetical protein